MPDQSAPDFATTLRLLRRLRAERRWEDAEAAFAAAAGTWPDQPDLLIEGGLLSQARMRWADAAERFATVRERFPGQLFGYSRGGEALRWLQRLDEADGIVTEGLRRFPESHELLNQWVLIACDRDAPAEAHERARTFLTRLPNSAESYIAAAEPFLRERRFQEADMVVAEGLFRFGPVPGLAYRFADLASAREDWPLAAARWEVALPRVPENEMAYRRYAYALRQLDRLDELEGVLTRARAACPSSLAIAMEHAWVASARHDWPEALARWRALAQRAPQHPGVHQGLVDAELQMQKVPAAPAASGDLAPAHAAAAEAVAADPTRLLLCFESIGINCEFGLVQRHAGLEPLGLLRFSSISHENLVAALDADLAGIGLPEFTRVTLRDNVEYMIDDVRYGLGMHTFTGPNEVTPERFARAAHTRLQFLARKLLEDLKAPSKIFVRTEPKSLPREQILRLHRAMRRHGPTTLLFVQESADPDEIGRAAWLTEGVMQGWVERLTLKVLDEQWLSVCRSAYALWTAPLFDAR